MASDDWILLRTKTDETTPDTDYVGTNTTPADVIMDVMPLGPAREQRYTGLEVVILGVDSSRVPVDRGANTCDITLIEVADREDPLLGGAVGLDPLIMDVNGTNNTPLQTKVYFPFAGGRFTIRISDNAAIAGVAALEVWWRPVVR